MRTFHRLLAAALFAAFAAPLYAITYIVPSDRDLVRRADAIAVVTAIESHAELRGDRIVTVATVRVERAIKGDVGADLEIVEMGGAVGDRVTLIPGVPRYEAGQRYLAFLRHRGDEWTTYGFGLGQFVYKSDLTGRELLVRVAPDEEIFGLDEANGALHVEGLRSAAGFETFVEQQSRGDVPVRDEYLVDRSSVVFETFPEFRPRATGFTPHVLFTRTDYLLAGNYRWQSPVASFVHCCTTQTGGSGINGPAESSAAMAAWASAGVGISYTLTGQDLTAKGGLSTADNKNAILFNDPNGEITGSGAVAIGGISNISGSYSNLGDGATYLRTTEVDVVTGNNLPGFVNASLYTQLMTHELGHTLGFRHADGTSDPLSPTVAGHQTPCQSPSPCAQIGQAIMASTIIAGNSIGSLGQWDRDAAQTVYGTGPVCTNPSITVQPTSRSITAGSQTTLTVTASGTSPTYQWYSGNPPNGSPLSGQTTSSLTVSPTTTTTYYVRVSGCSTFVDSAAATVTVTQATCGTPTINQTTANPSTVAPGGATTLSVSATSTGGTLSYQWYIGAVGNKSNPVNGGNSFSVSVNPTTTTSYWVEVTNTCGNGSATANGSVTVTVSNPSCATPSITSVTASPSAIQQGQSSTLTVNATGTGGTLSYKWYTGNFPDKSNPINGGTNASVGVSPTQTTSYWVEVTNTCSSGSSTASGAVTVLVSSPNGCPQPLITTQPQSTTITTGGTGTLSVVASGSGTLSYQWYFGNAPGSGTPLTGQTNATLTLASNTNSGSGFWVRVTNTCPGGGSATTDSLVAIVTVTNNCTNPSITTQPGSISAPIGTTTKLTVVAAGTGLHYQWYQGSKGDTTTKVGTDAASFTTPTISQTRSYWVRVSGACGTPVDSNAATVTATQTPKGRASRH